jgi:hypothetical protein
MLQTSCHHLQSFDLKKIPVSWWPESALKITDNTLVLKGNLFRYSSTRAAKVFVVIHALWQKVLQEKGISNLDFVIGSQTFTWENLCDLDRTQNNSRAR